MDELAGQLDHVLRYFRLESVVGLGVGAGGNVLARFAYRQPAKVIERCDRLAVKQFVRVR